MAVRPGISALFPAFSKDMTLYERTKITVKRHQYDYFKDWDVERFEEEQIPTSYRPTVIPVTPALHKENIKKNEILRNRKLAFCMEMSLNRTNEWAVKFRQEIKDAKFSSLTEIKDKATELWKTHSDVYDPSRAVHVPSLNGRGHTTKKTRRADQTEAEYRRRLRESRPVPPVQGEGTQLQSILEVKEELKRLLKLNKQQLGNYLTNSEGFQKLEELETLPSKTKEDCQVSAVMALMTELIE